MDKKLDRVKNQPTFIFLMKEMTNSFRSINSKFNNES